MKPQIHIILLSATLAMVGCEKNSSGPSGAPTADGAKPAGIEGDRDNVSRQGGGGAKAEGVASADDPNVLATGLRVDIRRALNKGDVKEAQTLAAQLKTYRAKIKAVYFEDTDKILKEVDDAAAGKTTTKPE